jgi:hypothetical protein
VPLEDVFEGRSRHTVFIYSIRAPGKCRL